MTYNIGINIVETNGTASPAIAAAPTSVAAFNIITQRGVPNSAKPVTSFQQFTTSYGSYFPGGLGAYLVAGFFLNGGQTAYINRVISSDPTTGAAPARLSLLDGSANATLQLTAGSLGQNDPGSWGNSLYVSAVPNAAETQVRLMETAPATITGTVALPATFDMSGFPKLTVAIDGQVTATVLTFKAADFPAGPTAATPAQVRDAINRQTTQLIASLSATNQLVLTSAAAIAKVNNSFSSLQVTAANTVLGFAAMAAPVNGTPAALAATGTQLASLVPFAVGDALKLTDGTNTAYAKLTNITAASNTITWAPALANVAAFNLLLLTISRVTFNLSIAYGGNNLASQVETWTALSMQSDAANYAVSTLNDPIQGSAYVNATDLFSASTVGLNSPVSTGGYAALAGGLDGTPTANDFIGNPATHTGFYAFDSAEVQLVTAERTDPAILVAGLAYCENRGDCMYVGSVPQGYVAAGQAIAYGQAFQASKVYGALYGPWINVTDPAGSGSNPVKTLPPVGHVMGIYARIATARGVWKAPAGDEANVLGALSLEYQLSDVDHTALVTQGSVNGIRSVAAAGIVVDASRTLSTDTRWLYVNVRLLFNFVKTSLKTGLSWVRQEPNTSDLWDAVRLQTVNPFLLGLWRQKAFGTGTAAQVYTIICDATNNPPSQVDLGYLNVAVYFYPSKPAETIVIIVGQQDSGATAAES
jgi:phage tail sheath protein FI